MFDGILFDLDGTLWDSTPAVSAAWNRVLSRHPEIVRGPITVDDVKNCMGLLLADIGRKLFPTTAEEVRARILEEDVAEMDRSLPQEGGTLFPRLEETLAELSGQARLFVVSNCGHGYIEAFYAAHGLEHFFTGCEYAARTGLPKSGNIAKVARDYGLKNPVYVGDTQLDFLSARDAGVPFLHAAYGFGTVSEPVPAVERFEDIPNALAAMCPP